jgi:hypothetical protein
MQSSSDSTKPKATADEVCFLRVPGRCTVYINYDSVLACAETNEILEHGNKSTSRTWSAVGPNVLGSAYKLLWKSRGKLDEFTRKMRCFAT